VMRELAANEVRQGIVDAAPEATRNPVRRWAADFWLNYLFWHAEHLPWLARRTKWFYLWFAFRYSHVIRKATAANARRIFGPDVSPQRTLAYGRAVMSNFYEFVYDIGRALHSTRAQMLARVEGTAGEHHYDAARALKRGAIVVTAHMGSFEVGTAALLERDRAVHVVFKRDVRDRFESIRTQMHRRLGVMEAPIDEGWPMWVRLRDALARDEIVMLQGDRVMPGQKGVKVPFLHGHLLLPTGPLKLAAASGAPIVPVFVLRTSQDKVRVCVEPPILVDPDAAVDENGIHPSLRAMATILERYVRDNPEQWLLFHPAFVEDSQPEDA